MERDKNRFHRYTILCTWHEEHLNMKNYRPRTIEDYMRELFLFRCWLENVTDVEDIDEITGETLYGYTAYLYDRALASSSIGRKVAALKTFFGALYDENKLYVDLRKHLHYPRVVKRLPSNILTEKEIQTVLKYLEDITASLSITDAANALLLRNHAVFEVAYGAGLRRAEIIGLELDSINYQEHLLSIHDGKGGKSRVLPLGKKGLSIVRRYVTEARPYLRPHCNNVFISCRGNPFDPQTVRTCVQKVIQDAGIEKPTTLHGLRHACATHMLNNGADIRYVQELLGHADLGTTQVYTHISIGKLKETHNKYHPREQRGF